MGSRGVRPDPPDRHGRCRRLVLAFLARAGRPVSASVLRANVTGYHRDDIERALNHLAATGHIHRSRRREPLIPNRFPWEVDREYLALGDPNPLTPNRTS
jgi:hypothetical protein